MLKKGIRGANPWRGATKSKQMKILKIELDVPQIVILPDGIYTGEWGGYIIKLYHGGKTYNLTTEVGVKGIGIKVVVTIVNGVAIYEQLSN